MTLTNYKLYIINPAAGVNLCTNPSFEVDTTGYTTGGSNTIAVSTTRARRGVKSCLITYQNNDLLLSYAVTLTAAAYVADMDIYIPAAYDGTELTLTFTDYAGASVTLGRPNMTVRDVWQRVHAHITPVGGDLVGTVTLSETGTNATAGRTINVDGVKIELASNPTTYFDGDSLGFIKDEIEYYWNGTAHASTSVRTANTRSGGELVDISTYGKILNLQGFGMPEYNNSYAGYVSGGSEYQNSVLPEQRTIGFVMSLSESSVGSVQTARAALYGLVKPTKTRKKQPIVIRYQGFDANGVVASESVDIYCVYENGLDVGDVVFNDRVNPTFTVPDGVFHKEGQDAKALGYAENITSANRLIKQNVLTGQWEIMGNGLGAGTAFKGVRKIKSDPKTGRVYIIGDFITDGAGGTLNNVAYWDGSAINPMANGISATVRDITLDALGNVYVCGDANIIKKWTLGGTAWADVGTPPGGGTTLDFQCVAVDSNNYVYVGVGNFLPTMGKVYKYTTSWAEIGTVGSSSWVSAFDVVDDNVYVIRNSVLYNITNNWENMGTPNSVNPYMKTRLKVFSNDSIFTIGRSGLEHYNGITWSRQISYTLDSGQDFYADNSNSIYLAGGTLVSTQTNDRVLYNNGFTSTPLDVNLPGTAIVYAIEKDRYSNLILGFTPAGTALSATVSVPNVEGADAYPIITLTGPGYIYQVKNYTTNQAIYFDAFTMLDGEKITIDLRPGRKTFLSDFRGNIGRFILDSSDIDFKLIPGTNNVSVLITGTTSANTSANIVWQANYNSIDEANYDS